MSNKIVRTAYSSSQAQQYDLIRFAGPAGKCIHDTELRQLFHALKNFTGGKIIEIGCGTGRLLIELLKRGYDVAGLDASEEMMNELKYKLRNAGINTELYVGECGAIPPQLTTFKFVYSIRLLNQTESVDYAKKSIGEMIRIAEPGGFVLIECVNKWRPRLGRNSTSTTRLSPLEIAQAGTAMGATKIYTRGAFFLGMGSYERSPGFALPLVVRLDRLLSILFPTFCSRTYVLFQKHRAMN